MTFINRENEPSAEQRNISVTVESLAASQSCGLLVSILLVNDNPPVVDLNGPSLTSVNHAASVVFDMPINSAAIASPDATITDLDQDGRIETVVVNLTATVPNADDRICLGNIPEVHVGEFSSCQDEEFSTCHFR